MAAYVIAVRRDRRSEVESTWFSDLAAVPGLEIVGDANPYRLRVEATESAIEVARSMYSSLCYFEPVKERVPLAG